MEALKKKNEEARTYLDKIDKSHWTRCHFSANVTCDLLCNNIYEAFNKYILEASNKPIITLLEIIRRMLMQRMQSKKDIAGKWDGDICSNIAARDEEVGKICWTSVIFITLVGVIMTCKM